MQASAKTTNAGIKAQSLVTRQGHNIAVFNKEQDIKGKQKMAGGLAALGKIAGASYLTFKKDDARERPNNTAEKNALIQSQIDSNKSMQESMDALDTKYTDLSEQLYSQRKNANLDPAKPAVASTKLVSSTASTGDGSYDGSFGSVYKMAKNSGASYPALVAAQWKLESAGGTAPSGKNNFFGIKALDSEAGSSKNTWEENSAGQASNTSARFKDFSSPQASVDELVGRWHKDYKGYSGVNNAGSRSDAAHMLKSEGYATDSKYANKLIRIMSENGYS